MPPLGFAIVGCGDVSDKHVRAINDIPGCQLVAACDINENSLKNFLQKAPVQGYSHLSGVLSDPNVDVVNICTPSVLHCSQVVAASLAGKHVLVEKPAALNLKEMSLEIAATGATGVILGVVHQNRFNRPVEALYRAVGEGRLGRIIHAAATVRRNRNKAYYTSRPWRRERSQGGGVLANQAIHNIDLLRWVMGPVEEIFSFTGTHMENIDGEEIALAVMRFASGALGVIEASSTVYPKNLGDTMSVFGDKGTVILGGTNLDRVIEWQTKDGLETKDIDCSGGGTHKDVINDMVNAINSGRKPRVCGDEAKKSLELLMAIYRSADTRFPVRISQEKNW